MNFAEPLLKIKVAVSFSNSNKSFEMAGGVCEEA